MESNFHHKQNCILLYQNESEQRCLLCRCPLAAAPAAAPTWADTHKPICYKFSITFCVLKSLGESFLSANLKLKV